jgi:hypothetical protein
MDANIDAAQLRSLPEAERRRLLRALVEIERENAPNPAGSWRWDVALAIIVVCCVALAGWIGFLAATLPHFYRTGSWRGAWVGFDIALLAAFVVTGWAAWRRRQVLVISLIVLSTLLFCDAWFDVVLDTRTADFWASVASALLVELPLAVLAAGMARRLLRLTAGQMLRYEGRQGPPPPLRKIPLLGPRPGTPLSRLMDDARARRREG